MTAPRCVRSPALGAVACLVLLVAANAREARAYAFLLVPGGGGVARRWDPSRFPDGRVPWRLARNVGGNVTGDRPAGAVLESAFAVWEDIPDASIRFAFAGPSTARNRDPGDGVNLVALGSQENLGSGVLAATFLSSDASGRLTDADIVFNATQPFTTSEVPEADRYDLQSIAAHEVGHLLGLEHSGLVRATMVPYSERGQDHQRTPESDDAIGAALLYPEGVLRGGSLAGRVTLEGADVFLAHVVATTLGGLVVAGGYTAPNGSYRIDGLPPDIYVVLAERLDGPVRPGNVQGYAVGFGATETAGYETSFH